LELARLIGYEPRPGVAASVHLAYNIEADRSVTPPASIHTIVPAGSRAQSIPGPGELPQSFETSDPLDARTEWNALGVRMTRPQTVDSIQKNGLYLKSTATNLKANDALLIEFPAKKGVQRVPLRVVEVTPEPTADRTHVTVRPWRTVKEASDFLAATAASMLSPNFPTKLEGEAARKQGESIQELSKLLAEVDVRNAAETIAKAFGALSNTQVENRKSDFGTVDNLLSMALAELELTRTSLVAGGGEFSDVANANPALDLAKFSDVLSKIEKPSSLPPANAARLPRTASTFTAQTDTLPRLLTALRPELASALYPAIANAAVTPQSPIRVHAFRLQAALFGNNAPRKPLTFDKTTGAIIVSGEWPIIENAKTIKRLEIDFPRIVHEEETVINLDARYEKIVHGSWLLVQTPETKLTKPGLLLAKARSVMPGAGRAEYGMSGKTTRIALASADNSAVAPAWIQLGDKKEEDSDFDALRQTIVYAQSEALDLAEEPITDSLCIGAKEQIELDGLYDGLDAGRWLVIVGERADINGTSGVPAAELAMLAGVEHSYDRERPGDKIHTFLKLSTALAYCYKRDTVTIYGNVVKATHGETRREVLGGGDSAKAMQTFALRQPPLTFVSAPDPSGIRSTLKVRVNDIEWHATDSLAGLGPADRKFIVQIDDDGKTKVVFGNGASGARPPTGSENIRADYRNGIGKSGNVQAGQISLLSSRPLGVKGVVNPLRASGGADRESRDQARRNAPLAVQSLDRLVSVQDYADFARTFAGIGKANAKLVADGARQIVHVTIAGADDIPIEAHSDLFRNLTKALREFGDPFVPFKVAVRELLLLFIAAKVRVLPDYEWESVKPKVQAALLDAFSFERRDIGQGVVPSEVLAVIQRVPGVEYVDLDSLRRIDQAEVEKVFGATLKTDDENEPLSIVPGGANDPVVALLARENKPKLTPRVLPAQLAFLSPAVPDTLFLSEITA
ncbi:MAG: putative baseplate assembly protein, partial [Chthoniobacteraceae bacterium]